MKVLITIMIFFILFGLAGFAYVDGALAPQNEKLSVLLQLQIRNSEGKLVSYVEGTKIITIQPELLNEFLDKKPNKIIIEDAKKYELIQWKGQTERFDKVHAMTIFNLWVQKDGTWISPLGVIHNSYQVEPGDTATVYWTIIRSV